MDIICECGHGINEHRADLGVCFSLDCPCNLTPQDIARTREQALVAALQPFADAYNFLIKSEPLITDSARFAYVNGYGGVDDIGSVGDLRRAAALAAAGEQDAQPSVQRTECMECGADLVLSGVKYPSGDFYCAACGTRN